MEKTKVAILGAGFIAHIHLESYKRFVHEAEVVAIYARSREKAEAVAAEFGIPGVYDDVDKLLAESGAEVVDVCMPNYTHYEACLKAARSGKHVIVEKPLAMTLEQADEMIAECKAHGVNLMYAEELCFARSTSACATSSSAALWARSICSSRPRSTAARTAPGSIRRSAPAAAS